MTTDIKNIRANIAPDSLFVARQPIFDRKKNIWGYELLFRKCEADTCALIHDPVAATTSIIADGFIIGSRGLEPGKTICINFSLKTLLDLALASESGQWRLAEKTLALLGIAQTDAAKTHNEATAWAKHFLIAT